MRKLNKNSIAVVAVSLVFGLMGSSAALAATTPSLGTATTFGILGDTYTNTAAGTTINGDLGYTTGPAVAPTVNGTTYVADGTYNQAGTDQGTALTNLNNQACTFTFASGPIDLAADTTHGPIGVYTPGVYCTSGAASIGTGGITLSGSGTYIFRVGGALTTVANSVVTLAGGASACNVFWTPTAATTLGANSTFVGINIDASGITIGSTVTQTGSSLAFGGTVSTDADTITVPACSVAPIISSTTSTTTTTGGGGNNNPAGRYVPNIGIIKIPTPLALPAGSGSVTYNYTVWNVGGQQPLDNITVTDDKCSPVTYVSGDVNGNGKIDPHEDWKYTCTTTLSTTTTNTAVATGYSDDVYHQAAIAKAVATVAVGSSLVPPIINIVKVPSRLTPFPFGGGNVTYTYTVTNPGIVAMNNISVTDDKCDPVSYVSGDANGNNLLDPGEAWIYTCQANIPITTMNSATTKGSANGFTATGYAFATVLVSAPGLPNTGFPPKGSDNILWNVVALAIGVLVLISSLSILILKKRNV